MYDNYKVIAVTPAGRKRYLEILVKYMVRLRPVLDAWHLWVNTDNQDDINYFKELEGHYDFIKVVESPEPAKVKDNKTIHKFFVNCTDPDTIYVRFDDDIVFVESKTFSEFLKFRIDNPNYFLVYANIINNGITTHLLQRCGVLPEPNKIGYCDYVCFDRIGWEKPETAEIVHDVFLKNISNLEIFKSFKLWHLHHYERCSINCISWLGRDFAQFNGIVGWDEEDWLSVEHPTSLKKTNCIFGDFVVSHFAFFTQRQYLEENTNYLECYSKLADHSEYILSKSAL